MPNLSRNSIPNALTIVRLLLAVAFVVVLSIHRFPDMNQWALPTAIGLFVVAALTDALDGYLARRWDAISIFGRVMDPLADKVLVLGAFIMLAGPNFAAPESMADIGGLQVTGFAPWMVIVILSRELLVTTLRGVYESRGVDFSATLSGKLKMILQSLSVPAVLAGVMMIGPEGGNEKTAGIAPAGALVSVNFWIAVGVTAVTAVSGWPYVARAMRASGSPSSGS